MPKQGEIDFVKKLSAASVRSAQAKPFSDPRCGEHFANFGVIFALLPAPPARLLDLGVGTGWTSVWLARRGFEVVGVDIASDMIALAEQQPGLSEMRLRFLARDYERLDFRDEFDGVLFYDALHHAEDEMEALAGAWRALKPGGVCLTVEPGAGHAAAVRAMAQRFGTTEKDMPPCTIIEIGKRIGFRECRIYPRPDVYAALSDPAEHGPVWRYCRAFARNTAKAILGPRRQDRHWLDNNHIVWMRK